jgi:hypothetical protein
VPSERPNDLRFSRGRNARASEFYDPLSATGGSHRAEPGARRARQLQPLVRRPQESRASPSHVAAAGFAFCRDLSEKVHGLLYAPW